MNIWDCFKYFSHHTYQCPIWWISLKRRLLFWYFLEHRMLPVIRIYWGHNFSISRYTVKHPMSQLQNNNGETMKYLCKSMLLWIRLCKVLSLSLCLKAVLRKLARWRKKTSAALERGREHEKQHWLSKKNQSKHLKRLKHKSVISF